MKLKTTHKRILKTLFPQNEMGISAKEISTLTYIDITNIYDYLNQLIEMGYIIKRTRTINGKKVFYYHMVEK